MVRRQQERVDIKTPRGEGVQRKNWVLAYPLFFRFHSDNISDLPTSDLPTSDRRIKQPSLHGNNNKHLGYFTYSSLRQRKYIGMYVGVFCLLPCRKNSSTGIILAGLFSQRLTHVMIGLETRDGLRIFLWIHEWHVRNLQNEWASSGEMRRSSDETPCFRWTFHPRDRLTVQRSVLACHCRCPLLLFLCVLSI